MFHRAGPEDHRCQIGVGQAPGDAELTHRDALAFAVRRNVVGNHQAGVAQFGLLHPLVVTSCPAAFGEGFARLVFAGQDAASQRAIGNDAQTLVVTEGEEFDFDVAVHNVVERLYADELVEVQLVTGPQGFAELPGAEVGTGDVHDLSLMDQIIQSA